MVDLLDEKINELQTRYLHILKAAQANIENENKLAVIDEIRLFWLQHAKIVRLYLFSHIDSYNTYVFTATTYLSLSDYEHLPFLVIGQKHIFDDPLCRHFNMIDAQETPIAATEILEITLKTIQNNIQILESCYPHIIILPVLYLSPISTAEIAKQSKGIFLSMFTDKIQTIESFLELDSIEGIEKELLPYISEQLIFKSFDDLELSFKDRFREYYTANKELFPVNANEPQVFLHAITGHIMQALDVLSVSITYRFVPYIRYEVCFAYLRMLAPNFYNYVRTKEIVFKSSVAHLLIREFCSDAFSHMPFNECIRLINHNKESNNLFHMLEDKGIIDIASQPEAIIPVINEYLSRICQGY